LFVVQRKEKGRMSQLKKIRNRINSVKNTEQITQAMKMVAAAKMKKAQERILNLRPYAEYIFSMMADVALSCEIQHPLLKQPENLKRVLLVVLTSDRGLCGGFNNNICRYAERYYHSYVKDKEMEFFFIGKKAKNYFQFRGYHGVNEMFNLDKEISYPLASVVSKQLMEDFTKGQYDGIDFIYNSFQSAISQKVTQEVFLPVDVSRASLNQQSVFSKDLIFEVSPEALIQDLINKHFTVQVYRCMRESLASEFGARMTAMENATQNAEEIISRLTLTFNKQRQSAITTELIEISSGAEAMKV